MLVYGHARLDACMYVCVKDRAKERSIQSSINRCHVSGWVYFLFCFFGDNIKYEYNRKTEQLSNQHSFFYQFFFMHLGRSPSFEYLYRQNANPVTVTFIYFF